MKLNVYFAVAGLAVLVAGGIAVWQFGTHTPEEPHKNPPPPPSQTNVATSRVSRAAAVAQPEERVRLERMRSERRRLAEEDRARRARMTPEERRREMEERRRAEYRRHEAERGRYEHMDPKRRRREMERARRERMERETQEGGISDAKRRHEELRKARMEEREKSPEMKARREMKERMEKRREAERLRTEYENAMDDEMRASYRRRPIEYWMHQVEERKRHHEEFMKRHGRDAGNPDDLPKEGQEQKQQTKKEVK